MIFFSVPLDGYCFDDDVDAEVQKNLVKSRVVAAAIKTKLSQEHLVNSEPPQLKMTADNVNIGSVMVIERFKDRAEKAETPGSLAIKRHECVQAGFHEALTEYLIVIQRLEPDRTFSNSIDSLAILLEKIQSKKCKPAIGSLTSKHSNYSHRQPSPIPEMTSTHRDGNRSVNGQDAQSSPEALFRIDRFVIFACYYL